MDTTLVIYKAAVTNWNKGTGGGSGLATERWDEDKLEQHKINKNEYDHTDLSQRSLILFDFVFKK